jgi:hypothetical protein
MGMVIVEILNDPVNRRGVSKKSGQEYNIWFQEAYLHQADGGYPQKFEFLVRDGIVLPRGKYTVTDRCFYINNDGRLSIRLEEGLAEPSTALADFGKTVQALKASA